MADLCSLLCRGALRGSLLHSAITLTLFTLVLRSGSTGEPWALCSEPDGVLEGDTDWLVGQPVSSIVNRHTDSNSQEQAARGCRQPTQAVSQSSRFRPAVISEIAQQLSQLFHHPHWLVYIVHMHAVVCVVCPFPGQNWCLHTTYKSLCPVWSSEILSKSLIAFIEWSTIFKYF